jgi:glycosyltransferase involved in cell wall biosynthesis
MAETDKGGRAGNWRNGHLRWIPLRLKEQINQAAGRPVFDLSFYLQFQPSSIANAGLVIERLRDSPRLGERRRIAFITPHLGPGGAENVLLEMARSLDRNRNEIFAIATHSHDSRYRQAWNRDADRVFDLARESEPHAVPSVLYSLILNWQMHSVVLQNSLFAYSVIPYWKRDRPQLKVIDVIHAVGLQWDIARATASVAPHIDTRIVISEAARKNLIALGTRDGRIRLIPNGIDLDHFHPVPPHGASVFRMLFAGRLDPVKRPLLLVDIALALTNAHPSREFRIAVAGDGPEEVALRRRIRRAGLDHLFEFRGYVRDLAPLLGECDALVLTSSNEGIPLTILEAFATARPVIASRAGAIEEALDENTGALIDFGPREAERFAEAIAKLMENPDLRWRMGTEARRRAELRYNQRVARQLYNAILEG